MGRTITIEEWLFGALETMRTISGGANVKVGLVGPIVGVRRIEGKEGREASDVVEVLTSGTWGKEVAKIFCPVGTYKEGDTFRAHVDVSVYQNRLSIRFVDKIDK